ncbi:uncharacterized protein LY89DRAFT_745190 [Mollisia scopiformis]|uniref:Peptidase A1 domain-containing protein n=1 Tax=Mollisia scopiformis TaxID=149040 RepID=A0A194XX45_MOLSC|nr:uncharacterized protein LY89DRAFT_745190 [Mollisia scopiformis]KUJ24357.1 hypothetical protein LY89DRAFT_745190 [Mollisia scopiformis]
MFSPILFLVLPILAAGFAIPNQKPSYTLHLTRIPSTNKTASHSLRQAIRSFSPTSSSTTPSLSNITSAELGQDFLANITFGSTTRIAIIDTGSSDTWLVQQNFTCVDYTTNLTISPTECHFGLPMPRSPTFSPLPNTNFNISYADGEYLNGQVGLETITFAGITVPKQEIALAYLAGWFGDS